MFHGRRLIWEIPLHGAKWDEDLQGIDAVVAGVLILRLHHPDDGVRNPVQMNGLADSFAFSKKLLLRVAAEECHAPARIVVLVIVETSFRYGDTADLGEGR